MLTMAINNDDIACNTKLLSKVHISDSVSSFTQFLFLNVANFFVSNFFLLRDGILNKLMAFFNWKKNFRVWMKKKSSVTHPSFMTLVPYWVLVWIWWDIIWQWVMFKLLYESQELDAVYTTAHLFKKKRLISRYRCLLVGIKHVFLSIKLTAFNSSNEHSKLCALATAIGWYNMFFVGKKRSYSDKPWILLIF